MTNATYTSASRVPTTVKSATQRRFGAGAVKSRLSRSSGIGLAGSGTVVRRRRPRTTPAISSVSMPTIRSPRLTWVSLEGTPCGACWSAQKDASASNSRCMLTSWTRAGGKRLLNAPTIRRLDCSCPSRDAASAVSGKSAQVILVLRGCSPSTLLWVVDLRSLLGWLYRRSGRSAGWSGSSARTSRNAPIASVSSWTRPSLVVTMYRPGISVGSTVG
jgi:hypothetical protein